LSFIIKSSLAYSISQRKSITILILAQYEIRPKIKLIDELSKLTDNANLN